MKLCAGWGLCFGGLCRMMLRVYVGEWSEHLTSFIQVQVCVAG